MPQRLTLFLVFFSFAMHAQDCNVSIMVPDDITICSPANIYLNGSISGDYFGFDWTGTNGYYNDINLNPSVSVYGTTTFTLKAFGDSNTNLIENPDFEDGNVLFFTEYTYNPVSMIAEGTYTVTANPNSVHPGFAACSAQSGLQMMVLNGAPNLAKVWCQTITVDPNTNYIFWTWATSVHFSNPARLRFSINNQQLGSQFQLNGSVCDWQQFYTTWNSGSNTTANICIENENTQFAGNDFAIDNLYFGPYCEKEKSFTVTVGDFEILPMDDLPPITCNNPEQFLNVLVQPNISGLTYIWTTQNGKINSDPNQSGIYVASGGTYTVSITSPNQCVRTKSFTVGDDSVPPEVSIFGNPVLDCNDLTTYLEAYTLNASNVVYEWKLPGNVPYFGSGMYVTTPGLYSVSATSTNGCQDTTSIEVTVKDNTFTYETQVLDVLDCSTDSVKTIINLLNPIDKITWKDTHLFSHNSFGDSLVFYQPGVYYFTLLEGKYCTKTDSIIIKKIPPLHEYQKFEPDTITCLHPNIDLFLVDTDFIQNINWTFGGDLISESDTVQINTPGLYHFIVVDSNGCQKTDSFFIYGNLDLPEFTVEIDSIDCMDNEGQFITNFVEEGTYFWEGQNEISYDKNPTFSLEGNYTLTVTGKNGCSHTETYFLPSSKDYPDIMAEIQHINCKFQQGSLSILVSVPSTVSWSGPEGSTGTNAEIQTFKPGIYNITATTLLGCIGENQFEIFLDTLHPDLNLSPFGELTCSKTSLFPDVDATNYHTFLWTGLGYLNTSDLQPEITDPGIYTLTLKNQNGCETSGEIIVARDTTKPVFSVTAENIYCAKPGTSLVIQGSQNLQYSLNNLTISNGFEIDQVGEYYITATNEKGCDSTILVTIEGFFTPHPVEIPPLNINCYQPEIWAKDVNFNADVQYQWQTLSGLVSSDSILIHQNQLPNRVIATNEYGCESFVLIEVNKDFDKPNITIHGNTEISCHNLSTSIEAKSNVINSSFLWKNVSDNLTDLSQVVIENPGTYVVYVLNKDNGCKDSSIVNVTKQLSPQQILFDIEPAICAEDKTYFEWKQVIGGNAPYSIFLDNIKVIKNEDIILPETKIYVLKIIDVNGCTLDTTFTVQLPEPFSVNAGKDSSIILGTELKLHPTSTLEWRDVERIIWTPNTGLSCDDCPFPETNPEVSTLYTIAITDKNGCTKSDDVWVRLRRINGYDAPNVIDPKNHNGNSRFTIYPIYNSISSIQKLNIYDRWGNSVFEAREIPAGIPEYGWDGTFYNQPVMSGVYIWVADIQYTDGSFERAYGDVLILR